MGAAEFEQHGKGATVTEAFLAAREQAAWEYGHGGYTGSLAEKGEFIEIPRFKALDATALARAFAGGKVKDLGWSGEEDAPIVASLRASGMPVDDWYGVFNDKWGPALAIKVADDEWLFCGMASY